MPDFGALKSFIESVRNCPLKVKKQKDLEQDKRC